MLCNIIIKDFLWGISCCVIKISFLGNLVSGRTFDVHGDEGAGHGRVAGQEERAALLQHAGEPTI